jgi:RNA polymerase sigma factor (sigma-70 family)
MEQTAAQAQVGPTDAALIVRALLDDDRHAFGELVRRHQSAVRAHLRRLTAGNLALADDLAQETFIQAYRNLKHFRSEAKFSTWLYRIAYNTFVSDTRRIRESQLAQDESLDDAAEAPSADANLKLDMERALRRLSESERAAIVQCYHNDLSHEEAAYVLDCPLGTVKTNILRAKEKLRQHLAAWRPE